VTRLKQLINDKIDELDASGDSRKAVQYFSMTIKDLSRPKLSSWRRTGNYPFAVAEALIEYEYVPPEVEPQGPTEPTPDPDQAPPTAVPPPPKPEPERDPPIQPVADPLSAVPPAIRETLANAAAQKRKRRQFGFEQEEGWEDDSPTEEFYDTEGQTLPGAFPFKSGGPSPTQTLDPARGRMQEMRVVQPHERQGPAEGPQMIQPRTDVDPELRRKMIEAGWRPPPEPTRGRTADGGTTRRPPMAPPDISQFKLTTGSKVRNWNETQEEFEERKEEQRLGAGEFPQTPENM